MTAADHLRMEGRRSTGVWGAAAGAGVLGVLLAYFLYAYLYLSVSAAEWPPGSIADPPLLLPGVLLGVLAVSSVAAVRAGRIPPDEGGPRPLVMLLGSVAVAGSAVLLVGTRLVAGLDLEPRADAYAAAFTTVHAVQGAATLAAVVIAGFAAYEAHRLGRHPWVAAATAVAALWWCTVVAGWFAVYAVVYAWPQLS